jgi:hypothetical protein
VHVGLVPGIPQEDVVGRIEDPVQGEGELDDAEVGTQVARPRLIDRVDDELADLDRERVELFAVEVLQVGR